MLNHCLTIPVRLTSTFADFCHSELHSVIFHRSDLRWIFVFLTPVRIALASIFTDLPSLHSLTCCHSEICWIFAFLMPVCIALTYIFAYLLSLRTACADLPLLRIVLDVCLYAASRRCSEIYLRLLAATPVSDLSLYSANRHHIDIFAHLLPLLTAFSDALSLQTVLNRRLSTASLHCSDIYDIFKLP